MMESSVWVLWVVFMMIFVVLVAFAMAWLMSHRHS
jgi:hypothetical protein